MSKNYTEYVYPEKSLVQDKVIITGMKHLKT